MSQQIRPNQISPDGAVAGQVLGYSIADGWHPVDPGGSTPPPTDGPFADDFERADTPLDGNNGWFKATVDVATFYIESGLVHQTGYGYNPILHDRGDDNTVADVTATFGWDTDGYLGATHGIVPCSDGPLDYGIAFAFDGTTWFDLERVYGASFESPTSVTDHGWAGWALTDTMVIRAVYTEATRLLEVYQNGVLKIECDMSDVNFGYGHELPALSTMVNGGFFANAGDHVITVNDFLVAGGTLGGGGGGDPVVVAVLDDLTDVDTTTTVPVDQQFLKFDATLNLWVPADLPSSSTGAPFDVTDTPEDPPPYAGYSYMTSDGKVRIWSGTEWRQILTSLYVPPAEGDAAITLDSLVARYRAEDLAYADGDPVTVWLDTSGLSNDLITHTAGTMVASGIGGLKSVQFSKATWYELTTPLSRPMTLVAVMKNTDTGSGSMVVTSGDLNTAYFGLVLGGGWRISDGSSVYVQQTAADITDPHVMYGSTDASTGIMIGADGTKTTSAGTVDIRAKYLGYWPAASGYDMQGLVSEVLIYNEVLTDSQLNDIIHQLGAVYSVTVSV